ncbi:MAG: RNA 2',3'-cyclic phosphodiesterase [Planctomycetes bacterium]|nr:RNA 2',3'-cyclic phosphodiesterase [Planctomycetota bacterium]
MRAFLAIEIPDYCKTALAVAGKELSQMVRAARVPKSDRLHITLVFLGEIQENTLLRLTHPLAAALTKIAPFDAALAGVGTFPARGRPRVFWCGVERGADSMRELAKMIAPICKQAGVTLDGKPFAPHVTLARVREHARREDLERAGDWLLQFAGAKFGEPWRVSSAVLYESTLSPEGPTYRLLARFDLAGGRPDGG